MPLQTRRTVHRRLYPVGGSTPKSIETRWRCIADGHQGVTWNPSMDTTFCGCGRVVRPGNHSRPMTEFERREAWPERLAEIDKILAKAELVSSELGLRPTGPSK